MSDILSQSEIDALLKIMDGEGADGGSGWKPGEEEILARVGTLIAQAAEVAWGAKLGTAVAVQAPSVSLVKAGEAALPDAPGLVSVARLGGSLQGRLAFWAGGTLYRLMAERALGADPGVEPLAESQIMSASALVTGFFSSLGEALGGLVGGMVQVETVGEDWYGPDNTGQVLASLAPAGQSLVHFTFPGQVEDNQVSLACYWGLEDARLLLSRLADTAAAPERTAPAGRGSHAVPAAAPAGPRESRPAPEDLRGVEFQTFDAVAGNQAPHNIDLILDVPLEMTVELGRTEKQIREILALVPGSVIELDRLAGEAVDVLVNGKLIARGEVVVVDDNFGIRITDIVSRMERLQHLK